MRWGTSRERFVARRIEHGRARSQKRSFDPPQGLDEDLRKNRGSRASIGRCTSRDPAYILRASCSNDRM
jgi:hypothetical protein